LLLAGCGGEELADGENGSNSEVNTGENLISDGSNASGGGTDLSDGGSTSGGGTSSGGISGSGVVAIASGTIDAFGSIFVNGIRYEIDDATIDVDGVLTTESELGIGMVVVVSAGGIDEENLSGSALSVQYNDELQGPITQIETEGESIKILSVLGINITADQDSTVFEGTSFDSLSLMDVIEVSGYYSSDREIIATRIEKIEAFNNNSLIELTGSVSNLVIADSTFELQGVTVDYSSADLTNLNGISLSDGLLVEAQGTLVDNTIIATTVSIEDNPFSNVNAETIVIVEGIVSNYVSDGEFSLSGISVNAQTATLEPSDLAIENGDNLQIRGFFVDNVLVATKVTAERTSARFAATVQAIDSVANTLTLEYFTGTVTVQVDNETQLEDTLGVFSNYSFGDIAVGDFLRLVTIIQNDRVTAHRILRENLGNSILFSEVESFRENDSVTLLGIPFTTAGATFGRTGEPLSEAQFYEALTIGALITVTDNAPIDGIADRVIISSGD